MKININPTVKIIGGKIFQYAAIGTGIALSFRAGKRQERWEQNELQDLINEIRKDLNEISEKDIKRMKIKHAAKELLIPIAVTVAGAGGDALATCTIKHEADKKTALAIASALSSKKALDKFEEKVKEVAGDKVVEDVKQAIVQDRADESEVPSDIEQKCLMAHDGGNVDGNASYKQLFFEPASKQYFRSSVEDIMNWERITLRDLQSGYEEFVTLESMFADFDIKKFPLSGKAGFSKENYKGYNAKIFNLNSTVMSPSGIPAIVLKYKYSLDPDLKKNEEFDCDEYYID